MKTKWFMSKKELLKYLGKNPNDRKLVDRMVERGEVKREGDTYGLIMEGVDGTDEEKSSENVALSEDDREEYLKIIKELEGQLAESQIKQEQLEQRNAYLEERINGTEDGEYGEDKSSSNELEEAKIQREYYENKANKYKEAINKVIEVTYSRIKPALGSRIGTLAEFRVNILEEVSDLIRE